MKKNKMMLLSLALFAVVGAALAFKARLQSQYCTGTPIAGIPCTEIACPNHAISTFGSNGEFACSTTYDGNNCETTDLKCTTTPRTLKPD